MVCTPPAYSAPASGATTRARSASTDVPGRRAASQLSVASSTSTTPALAEHSVAMLASVARSSGESERRPGKVSIGTNAALKAIQDDPSAAGKALDLAAVPTDRKTGEEAVGSNSKSAYNTALDTVVRQAKP